MGKQPARGMWADIEITADQAGKGGGGGCVRRVWFLGHGVYMSIFSSQARTHLPMKSSERGTAMKPGTQSGKVSRFTIILAQALN